jgi:hypothetical protein
MATYDNDLRLKEITTGDEDGTWGVSTNTNLDLVADALGYATQDGFAADADSTTTVADGAADPARAMYLKVTSSATLTTTRTLTIAPNTISRVMFIENATTGSQSIEISQGSGANVTVPTGKSKLLYLDGAGATAAVVDITSTAALANLTLASGSTVTSILDEDGMGSDSDTALATQQSIKAYVDANAGGSTLADTLTAGNSTSGTDIVVTSGDSITTNTISETTAASGVTVDGLLVKDTAISFDSGSNYLDDYEEGSFTPTLSDAGGNSGTLSQALGNYTKIGNLVTFTAYILVGSLGSMATVCRISGLPFTNNGTSFDASCYIGGDADGLAISAGQVVVGEIAWLGDYINIWLWDTTTGTSPLTPAELSADGELRISGQYFTTS